MSDTTNELRQAILTEFKQVHKLAPADYTENCTNVVMSLIAGERQRWEVAARKDEERMHEHLAIVENHGCREAKLQRIAALDGELGKEQPK